MVTVTVIAALVVPTVSLPKLTGEGDIVISVPLPLKAIVCGLMQALSATVSPAERDPIAAGVNVSLIMHFAPAARVAAQELLKMANSLASVPVTEKLVRFIETVPALVRVNVTGELVVLISWLGNDSGDGEKVVAGAPLYVAVADVVPGVRVQPKFTVEKLPVSEA